MRANPYVVWAVIASLVVITLSRRVRANEPWRVVLLASLATASVFAFGVVNWGRATPFGDFNKAYYPAGVMAVSDPSRLYECTVSNLCFVNIPIIAALFTPFAWLDVAAAQIAFTVVGVAAVVAAASLVTRGFNATRQDRYAVVALFALNGPLLYSARLGNLTHVMLPFLAFAMFSLIRGNHVQGGAVIAVLAAIKPPLLLFAPYFVARGQWRAALALSVTLIALAAASVIWFGIDLHKIWLLELAQPFSDRPVAAYNVQSVAGALAHLLYPGNLTNWEPLAVGPYFKVLQYAIVGAIAGTAAFAALLSGPPKSNDARWIELSMVLILSLLASPLTWTHYYAFCVIPLSWYVIARRDRHVGWTTAMAVSFVLLSLPVVLAMPNQPLLRALSERVLISHYVLGAIVLLGALSVLRWREADGSK